MQRRQVDPLLAEPATEFRNHVHHSKSAVRQVAAIKQGTTLVLQCRNQRRYDQAALTASEKLLKVVPEVRTCKSNKQAAQHMD
jgi:hypothetical protein